MWMEIPMGQKPMLAVRRSPCASFSLGEDGAHELCESYAEFGIVALLIAIFLLGPQHQYVLT